MLALTRTERAAIYAYAENDAGNGYASSVWTRVYSTADDGCWWASLSEPSGKERTTGQKEEQIANASIGVAIDVPVPERCVFKINGRIYKIITALLRPSQIAPERRLPAFWSPDAKYTLID